MNQVSALFKKEWIDFFRNYRLLILAIVFFILAFSSPLTAKFMPEILGNFLPKDVADSFPTPTAFDSWQQFFKNFSQIGLFVFVLIFGASLSNERQHGTLVIPLTKGLSRTSCHTRQIIILYDHVDDCLRVIRTCRLWLYNLLLAERRRSAFILSCLFTLAVRYFRRFRLNFR